jgi:hypothetical protein
MTRLARPPLAHGGADKVPTHPPAARTAGPLTSADALLTLQRSAGNRAVTHLVRQLSPLAVQRKLSYTPDQLNAERSVFGRMKGARTKDTLYKITETLRLYQRAVGAESETVLLQALIGLSDKYKQRHPLSEKNNAKASVVDDLQQAAQVELQKLEAMQQYLSDVSSPMVPKPGSKNEKYNPMFSHLDEESGGAAQQAKEMVAGTGQASEEYRRTTKELIAATGISEGELTAILIFTQINYKYMGPAMANSWEWMAKMKPEELGAPPTKTNLGSPGPDRPTTKTKDDPAYRKDEKVFNSLREQGALHAAMALSGLEKLPVTSGIIYRGTGEYPSKIAKSGDVINVMTIQSWTQSKDTADQFTNNDDGKVPVVYEINTTRARNINALKGEQMAKAEPEWVLLPGDSYRVDSVETGVRFHQKKGVTLLHCTES